MVRVLITGSNGLLGQKLAQQILEDPGLELIATSRGDNRNQTIPSGQYESLDITDKEQVMRVMAKHRPDAVINTAAMTNVDQCEREREECWQLNVTAVDHLVEACKASHSRLVHLSTDFIFDGKNGPYVEQDTANPVSHYGESKLASEQVILNAGINSAILRTVLVYGIVNGMSRSNIVLWVKESLEEGKPLKIVDDQWRTPTLAEDLAAGCLLAVKHNANGVYHISGIDFLTPYEMAIRTAAFFKLDAGLIEKVDGSTFQQEAKRPARTGFMIDKARQELGYEPHTFDQGLQILSDQITNLKK